MQTTIAMALSGGIDSLVAGYLLKSTGHRVIGIHFRSGFENDPGKSASTEPQALASHLAEQLKIPVSIVDLSQPFREKVVAYFSATYMAGKTPNPCLVCNPIIKFEILFDHAKTGHLLYAGSQ